MRQSRTPWLTFSLAAVGAAAALHRLRRGDSFAALCIGFGILQVLGYQILGAPGGYPWYFAPGNFAVDIAVTLGLVVLARWMLPPASYAAPVACMLALVLMTQYAMSPWLWPRGHWLAGQYRDVAGWLRAHGRADDTFAATEIGYLGWYSGLRVLDVHGLLHSRALASLRASNMHWWWDQGHHPRFVVVHSPPWHGEAGSPTTWPAALNDEFAAQYHEAFRTGVMRVLERNDMVTH